MAANANKTHFPRAGGNTWVQSFYASLYREHGVTGNVWWVSSGGGTDSAGYGYSPEAPLATIAYAVATAAVADNNDIVIVMPGHTETITGAAGVAMSKAGVTVRGLGVGRQRGKINYTSAVGASFDITAARCYVENLTFTGIGVDNVTAMINVSAADVTIQNCELEIADATNQAALAILTTTAADRFVVDNCHIHGTSDAGAATAIRLVGGTDVKLTNNVITGAFTTSLGGIQNVTNAAVNLIVSGNLIQNKTASANVAVTMVSTTTGMIVNNRLVVLTGTAPIVAANCAWVGNYYANTLGTASVLI